MCSLNQILLLILAACPLPVRNDPKSRGPKKEFPPIWMCRFLEQSFSTPSPLQMQKELSSGSFYLPPSFLGFCIPHSIPILCSFSTPELTTNSKIPLTSKFQAWSSWLGWEFILLTSQLVLPVTSSANTSKQLPHCTLIVLNSQRTEMHCDSENVSEPWPHP